MSKEFAFEEGFRHGAAIHCDNRKVTPRAVDVNRPGDQFFSRTAFSPDHHCGIGLCHRLCKFDDLFHLRAVADNLVSLRHFRNVFMQLGVLFSEFLLTERIRDKMGEMIRVDRLR